MLRSPCLLLLNAALVLGAGCATSQRTPPLDGHSFSADDVAAFAGELDQVALEEGTSIRIHFGIQECFGASESRIRLVHTDSGFTLEGFRSRDTRDRAPTNLSHEQGAAIIRNLAGALRRAEVRDRCWTTGKHFARVSVRRDGSAVATNFTSCFDDRNPTAPYAWGHELSRVAESALLSISEEAPSRLTAGP